MKIQQVYEMGQNYGGPIYGVINEVHPVMDGEFYWVISRALNPRGDEKYHTFIDKEGVPISGKSFKYDGYRVTARSNIAMKNGWRSNYMVVDSEYTRKHEAIRMIKSIFGYTMKVKLVEFTPDSGVAVGRAAQPYTVY